MKVIKSGVSFAKKGLLYFLIIGLVSNNLQASIHEGVAYVLAAGMGVSAAWAIYERMSKRNLELKTVKLEEEVNSFNSEENIKKYLLNMVNCATQWDNFLAEANSCIDGKTNEEDTAEGIINCIYHQIKKYAISPDEFQQRLHKGIADLTNKINELYLKGDDLKAKPHLLSNSIKLIEKMGEVLKKLKEYNALFEDHKDYLKLLFLLDKGIEQEFSQEIEYAYVDIPNWHEVIHQIIKTKGNQRLFPYYFYAQGLQLKLDELSKQLSRLSEFKAYPFQAKKIERAKNIADALQVIFQFVSTSDILAQEKDAKVEYDRKEQYIKTEITERKELLRLETKERESKIAQQNSIAEAKLVEQQNKKNQLANEKARIEKDRKNLELQNKENALQLARIHEGDGIKKALNENNAKWHIDYNQLNSQHQKLSRDHLHCDSELKSLRIKLSALESDIKLTHSNHVELERKARNLEVRISNVVRAIDNLSNKVNNPPFNPESVYGLSDYINGLNHQVKQLKTLVA